MPPSLPPALARVAARLAPVLVAALALPAALPLPAGAVTAAEGAPAEGPAPAEVDGVPLPVAQEIFQVEVLRLPTAALTAWVADPDPDVRRHVARAIGRLRDATEGASLLAAMAADPDPAVREEVAFALGQTPDVAGVLVRRWAEELDPGVRAALAVALGKQGGPDAVPLLLDALGGPDALAAAAAEGIGRLAGRKVDAASTEAVAGRLLDRLTLPTGAARVRAAWALSRGGPSEPSPAFEARLRAAAERDSDPLVRAWLWRAWAALTTAQDRGPTLARAARDADDGVRIAVARAIARTCPGGLDNTLAALVGDKERAVRLEGIAAVGACRGGSPQLLLQAALADPDPRVVAAAVTAANAAGVLDDLGPWLEPTRPMAVRLAAVRASPDARFLVTTALHGEDPRLRSAATEALLGRPVVRVADLTALLGAEDPVIATAAADTLREKPDPAAEGPLLTRLGRGDLDDPSALVFVRALAALYGTGKVKAAAPEASTTLQRYLARPVLAAEIGKLATVLKVVPGPAVHSPRKVPSLEQVLAIRSARLYTEEGEIRIALRPDEAPYAVWNFARLAEEGWFDGVAFHRVVPDFVIQAGDPRGDGWGGPGWEIPDEINRLPYDRGAVGMALSGPDTGGSQWFVTLSPQPHLEGTYTVFGHVSYGMRNAAAIDQGDTILHVEIERVP